MQPLMPRALLSLLLALACAACGSSTPTPVSEQDDDDFTVPDIELRAIPEDALARRAICYSGYRQGQSPDIQKYPSEDEIREDLKILERGKLTFIRLFDSGVHAQRVLSVIEKDKLDFKVLLGIWISGAKAKFDTENQKQIKAGAELANKYKDVVVAVSVGNETLDDWSGVKTSPKDLTGYMLQVRELVEQPITTDDSWLPFLLGRDGETDYARVLEVAKVSDFLSLHTYAFSDAYWGSWKYQQLGVPEEERAEAMMAAAFAYTKDAIQMVRDTLADKGVERPIVIGEAGWKDRTPFTGDNIPTDRPEKGLEQYMAHPINQKIFYEDLVAWVYGADKDENSPLAAFYFEAFDEPWKGEWGDDGWGLFDVDRQAKYLMWDEFSDLKPKGAEEPAANSAVYYVEPEE